MNCDEAETLLHALVDNELDAEHTRAIETHIAECPACAAELRAIRELRMALASARLVEVAPDSLRRSIKGKLPLPRAPAVNRRSVMRGIAIGAAATALAASGLLLFVEQNDDQQRLVDEVVSAHLRSMQAQHLTDVVSTDQHTVKPWFNGRLDVAPPVGDLTAGGFTLLGGRVDYVDAKPVAAIVYRRRVHIINLFCAPAGRPDRLGAAMKSLQGFNVLRWRDNGLDFWAVSDINADELSEFGEKFRAAVKP